MLTRLEKQMPLQYLKSALRQIARDFRKLSVHVTDADTSGKANASPISKFASSISKIRRVQRLHVTNADKSGIKDGPWFLSKPSF
ncbi:hypothetical protein ACFX1X_035007 [Malus domestica]